MKEFNNSNSYSMSHLSKALSFRVKEIYGIHIPENHVSIIIKEFFWFCIRNLKTADVCNVRGLIKFKKKERPVVGEKRIAVTASVSIALKNYLKCILEKY